MRVIWNFWSELYANVSANIHVVVSHYPSFKIASYCERFANDTASPLKGAGMARTTLNASGLFCDRNYCGIDAASWVARARKRVPSLCRRCSWEASRWMETRLVRDSSLPFTGAMTLLLPASHTYTRARARRAFVPTLQAVSVRANSGWYFVSRNNWEKQNCCNRLVLREAK